MSEIVGAAHVLLAVVVSAHIVLTKEDVRAAIGWTGLVWLAPIFGSLLYLFFGINRIRRRAGRVRGRRLPRSTPPPRDSALTAGDAASESVALAAPGLAALDTLVGRVTHLPLAFGNTVEPLLNGDAAYPAMLAEIERATATVGMATYIFDRGESGDAFVDALACAVQRGVTVRVLIDGVGARYSRPPIVHELRRRGVTVERFLPSSFPVVHPYVNLRNHRKMLVVDGRLAFCGGMNIRDGCVLARHLPGATQDVHFRITGPVARHVARAFAFDWEFTAHERLDGDAWFPPLAPTGAVPARGIADGPDEDFETLVTTILGAVSQASHRVRIVTPYFLPDAPLLDALRVAALRGVAVEIVLPEHGNLRLVQWASSAILPQVLAGGCRVFLSRPPFDHSKLLTIDGAWSLVGSANWDPRSLRLNFEYDVECYSRDLAATLDAVIDDKIAASRELTLQEVHARPLAFRLRDGVARLAQPYL